MSTSSKSNLSSIASRNILSATSYEQDFETSTKYKNYLETKVNHTRAFPKKYNFGKKFFEGLNVFEDTASFTNVPHEKSTEELKMLLMKKDASLKLIKSKRNNKELLEGYNHRCDPDEKYNKQLHYPGHYELNNKFLKRPENLIEKN